ncbi:MAG TPA: TROVE domain-containing protein [Pseudonocardiaceae bacterium]|nr:TROVE domain-containing protein [Pseudonocardiaceae bacterium]
MAKFNTAAARPSVSSPVTSEAVPSGTTHEGAPGYAREVKSELFLLAVSNMVAEKSFYEAEGERDDRYANLIHSATADDPEWTARFLRWLRTEANMRTAALVGAAEYVRVRLATGDDSGPANRSVIDSVLRRADEPGELLAYWTRAHGRTIPKPIKRGVADAVARLYDERSLLKWDSAAAGYRFGDVLDLTHPAPRADWQGRVFRYAIDRRHGHDTAPDPETLPTLAGNVTLRALAQDDPTRLLDAAALKRAGMTWEDALSLAGSRVDKAKLWEALIPGMGYMALLRNLRAFDLAGVSDEVAATVAARLADPEQVARSRQFPMRFLSAYRAAPSLRWSYPLEQAITHALANVPAIGGRTLVLVDTSGSMDDPFSKDGTLKRWDAAAIFGIALATRCANADVVSFSKATVWRGTAYADSLVFPMRPGESLLRAVERWKSDGYFIGAGTDTEGAVRKHLKPGWHDRVVILTDEQDAHGDVGQEVPADVALYTWNLAGYQYGHAPSGGHNRHTFGGLTDQAFRMIPLLESGRDGGWPF